MRKLYGVRPWEIDRLRQRGAATTELVLIIPCLMLMLGLLLAGGRLWFAKAAVADAATSAARAASLARTAQQAHADAEEVALSGLTGKTLHCRNPQVQVDASAYSAPVGRPTTVTAQVSCRIDFADIFLPGMPGTVDLTATGRSALDTYRGRS